MRLDPVIFAPGSATLEDSALQYLERVAELMKNRPKMRVNLCGKATETDRVALSGKKSAAPEPQKSPAGRSGKEPQGTQAVKTPEPEESALDDSLRSLASQRALAIMAHLVNQNGIERRRLFVCSPEIDTGSDAKPRVELLI